MKFIQKNKQQIFVLIVISFLSSCSGYERVIVKKNQPIPLENKAIVLHTKDGELHFYDVDVFENHFRGKLSTSIPEFLKEEQVHIFIDSTFIVPEAQFEKATIPFTAIKKVDVYEIDIGKTIAYNIGAGAIAICVMVLLIVIDFKND